MFITLLFVYHNVLVDELEGKNSLQRNADANITASADFFPTRGGTGGMYSRLIASPPTRAGRG